MRTLVVGPMNLLSVMTSPSFRRALAWVERRQGPPPRGWLPDGLERLDDTWFAHHPTRGPRKPPAAAFAGLPEGLAARAMTACGDASTGRSRLPPALCEVCARWCWSDLVDLPSATDPEASLLDAAHAPHPDEPLAAILPRLSTHTVTRAMSLAGLEDLGGLLSDAPDRAAAAICGRLPAAWRRRVWRARTTGARPGHAALAELATLTRTGDPTEVLFSLGAGRFATLLAPHPRWLRQTAQLLPMPVARHLLGAGVSTGSAPDTVLLVTVLREAIGDSYEHPYK